MLEDLSIHYYSTTTDRHPCRYSRTRSHSAHLDDNVPCSLASARPMRILGWGRTSLHSVSLWRLFRQWLVRTLQYQLSSCCRQSSRWHECLLGNALSPKCASLY